MLEFELCKQIEMMLLKPNQHDPLFQFCKYQNKSYIVVDCKRLTSIDKLLTSPYSFLKTKKMFNLQHTQMKQLVMKQFKFTTTYHSPKYKQIIFKNQRCNYVNSHMKNQLAGPTKKKIRSATIMQTENKTVKTKNIKRNFRLPNLQRKRQPTIYIQNKMKIFGLPCP